MSKLEKTLEQIIDNQISVVSFDESDGGFTLPQFNILLAALKNNKSVKSLGFNNCDLSPAHTNALIEMVRDNTTLTSLAMVSEDLGWPTSKKLSEMLVKNNTLRELNLNTNKISIGAFDLAQALEQNETLTALSLCNNSINDLHASNLIKMLKTNKALLKINLANNPINFNKQEHLEVALKSNINLADFSIGRAISSINDETQGVINKCIIKNNAYVEGVCSLIRENFTDKEAAITFDDYRWFKMAQKISKFSINDAMKGLKVDSTSALEKVGSYIKENYFKLIGVCNLPQYDNISQSDVCKNIVSFLGPQSLWEVKLHDKVSNIDSTCTVVECNGELGSSSAEC